MRTATCKHCGKGGLHWGSGYKVLYEASQAQHRCSSVTHESNSSSVSRELSPTLKSLVDSRVRQMLDLQIYESHKWIVTQMQSLFKDVEEMCEQYKPPVEHHITISQNEDCHKIEGHFHRMLPTLINVTGTGLHTMLVGPAGGGKTTAAKQTAEALEKPYYEIAMHPAMTQWDLVGFKSVTTGQYIKGFVREPYENGGVLMLDEIDNSDPSVLVGMNSILANDTYSFPDTKVEKHKDFVCIGAGNTYGRGADRMYVGRNQLDAATLDRFVVVDWDYDEEAELDWAGQDQIRWTRFVQSVRHEVFAPPGMRYIVSPRASINGATLLRNNMPWDDVANMVLWKGMNSDDRSRIERKVKYNGA